MEVSCHLYAMVALAQERAPLPLDRRLGGPQSQHGCSSDEKKDASHCCRWNLVIQHKAWSLH